MNETEFQALVFKRFAQLEPRLCGIDAGLGEIGERSGGVSASLDNLIALIDQAIVDTNAGFDRLEAKCDKIDATFDRIDATLDSAELTLRG